MAAAWDGLLTVAERVLVAKSSLVFGPGGAATDFVGGNTGAAFSTENASVFITSQAVECLFRAQQSVLGSEGPIAVELSHHRPTTIVFWK